MSGVVYPWQNDAWLELQRLRARLPHAVLFHGAEGTGNAHFAERFAQSLLCESPAADGHACGTCISCGWFSNYAHPDYRRVRPEALDDEDGVDTDEGADAVEEKKTAKTAKAPSRDIKIDQVRALAGFTNISTHRQGKRVILMYPAEALNGPAANALLKTLEEPPPETVFLMVSNSLDRLLPTILSRCRKFALPMPGADVALAWLASQNVKDADVWLAEQGGAPLLAVAASEAGSRATMDDFLGQLAKPDIESALKTAERLQKVPVTELVAWLQRWLHDVFSLKTSGRIRYYPRYELHITAVAGRTDLTRLMAAIKSAADRRAIAEHPLSAKLFIEDMLLEYASLFT
ncbi:MAG: DNA polymerase III subunit delta' [Herminiimonas sp.]|nr:DNA polymerase III subunit delta' [Herminiimonas sp.]